MVVLVPGHVRAVLQLAGKTTQVENRTVCGPMVGLVPGHVRAVLQLAGKTTQVQYRTVWTNGSAGRTWSREGCPTGRQNYQGTVQNC